MIPITTEEAYTKYICSNCINTDESKCEIRIRYDNTMYCKGYIKDKTLEDDHKLGDNKSYVEELIKLGVIKID